MNKEQAKNKYSNMSEFQICAQLMKKMNDYFGISVSDNPNVWQFLTTWTTFLISFFETASHFFLSLYFFFCMIIV